MSEVSRILQAIERGDQREAHQLISLVYAELRKLAASRLRHEKPGQTLTATALVHEAFVRLVGDSPTEGWQSQGHFFAAAAEAMRRILIERARRRKRIKHGGRLQRVVLNASAVVQEETPDEILDLDDALSAFAAEEPEAARVVKLRYFAGLTTEQAAQAMDISVRTANRHWAYAKAWLFEHLSRDLGD